MDNNSVKENIIRRRKGLKLSQQDMADKIGMSRTAYRNIEKGGTKLLSENVARIAEALEMDAEELVLGYSYDSAQSKTLKDEKPYRRMYEELDSRYRFELKKQAEEMSRLVSEISTLKEYIEVQKTLINTKDEIISMLRKPEGR